MNISLVIVNFLQHISYIPHICWKIKKNEILSNYIYKHTVFLDEYDYKFTFMERIWYVINRKTDVLRCIICGKPLLQRLNSLITNKIPKTCNGKCKSIGTFEKRSASLHKKCITKLYEKLKTEEVIPQFQLEEFLENYKPKQKHIYHKFKWKCVKCGAIFEDKFNLNFYNRHDNIAHARCYTCHPLSNSAGISKAELEIYEYVKTIYHGDIRQKDRQILRSKNYRNPFELDIYFPDLKLAIEYNGLYWHGKRISARKNDQKKRVQNSHIVKTKLCESVGIKLIHIWEQDWINNKDSIKDLIKNALMETIDYRQYLIYDNDKLILDRSKFNLANNFKYHNIIDIIQPKTETLIVYRGKKSKIPVTYKIKTCGYIVLATK